MIQLFKQADPAGAVESEHLADQERPVDGVFVADVRAGEVAVGLFKTEQIAVGVTLLFKQPDLLADEFESGQHVDRADPVVRRDALRHIDRDDGLDHHGIGGHLAVLRPLARDIVEQEHPDLVAGQQLHTLSVADGDPHSVGVGVGREQKVGVQTIGVFQPELQRLADLGVRVGAGREIAVGVRLFLDHRDIGEAGLAEHAGNGLQAGAV